MNPLLRDIESALALVPVDTQDQLVCLLRNTLIECRAQLPATPPPVAPVADAEAWAKFINQKEHHNVGLLRMAFKAGLAQRDSQIDEARAEVARLKEEHNAEQKETGEAWEIIAASFPTIQVDCEDQESAARFICEKYEGIVAALATAMARTEALENGLRKMLEYYGNPRPIEWSTLPAYQAALEVCIRARTLLATRPPATPGSGQATEGEA